MKTRMIPAISLRGDHPRFDGFWAFRYLALLRQAALDSPSINRLVPTSSSYLWRPLRRKQLTPVLPRSQRRFDLLVGFRPGG